LVGLQRIEYESGQLFTEQETQNIVGVMPSGFKPDFNFTVVAGTNFGVKFFKAFNVVCD